MCVYVYIHAYPCLHPIAPRRRIPPLPPLFPQRMCWMNEGESSILTMKKPFRGYMVKITIVVPNQLFWLTYDMIITPTFAPKLAPSCHKISEHN